MTNPSRDPYDVEGRHVWDAEKTSPLSGERRLTEEQRARGAGTLGKADLTAITPAEIFDNYEATYEGR